MEPIISDYLARRFPVRDWLSTYGVRETEKRLNKFGLSQREAKRVISHTKQSTGHD